MCQRTRNTVKNVDLFLPSKLKFLFFCRARSVVCRSFRIAVEQSQGRLPKGVRHSPLRCVRARCNCVVLRNVRKRAALALVGLYYEDCLIEHTVVDEALRRLPEEELVARDQRLKRAFDLSFKKIYLPVEEQTDLVHKNHYYLSDLRKEVRNRASAHQSAALLRAPTHAHTRTHARPRKS